jgi:hypothetical protein
MIWKMEIEEFLTGIGLFVAAYVIGSNNKEYSMAKKWSDSHPSCNIQFYDDWLQHTRTFCTLNRINTLIGTPGRMLAYRGHRRRSVEQ